MNRSVSRQHARIHYGGESFFVYDTGSQNGTSVERGKTVLLVPRSTTAGAGVELQDGDILVFGRARVRFRLGRSGESGDPGNTSMRFPNRGGETSSKDRVKGT